MCAGVRAGVRRPRACAATAEPLRGRCRRHRRAVRRAVPPGGACVRSCARVWVCLRARGTCGARAAETRLSVSPVTPLGGHTHTPRTRAHATRNTYGPTHAHTPARIFAHTRAHTHACTHAHAHTHTHAHTHPHAQLATCLTDLVDFAVHGNDLIWTDGMGVYAQTLDMSVCADPDSVDCDAAGAWEDIVTVRAAAHAKNARD